MNPLQRLREQLILRAFALISPQYEVAFKLSQLELRKTPSRTTVLNYLLQVVRRRIGSQPTSYLEIGVRRAADNFALIEATHKFGVDPGIEVPSEQVDFPLTSDDFFTQLQAGTILSPDTRFDLIFIDGLHRAEQVDRDITNAWRVLKEDGFIVLHDCNPPTDWHAREVFSFHRTPHRDIWNGTTWKAFVKWRGNHSISSCCIDSDWGIGILTKSLQLGPPLPTVDPFFEYQTLARDRQRVLNLTSFADFQQLVDSQVKA